MTGRMSERTSRVAMRTRVMMVPAVGGGWFSICGSWNSRRASSVATPRS